MKNCNISRYLILAVCVLLCAVTCIHSLSNLDIIKYKKNKDAENLKRRQAIDSRSCERSHVVDNQNYTSTIHIRFPKVVVSQNDQYQCTAFKVPFDGQDSYITKYIPHTSAMSTHHMLVFGCSVPFQRPGTAWDCGAMGRICGPNSTPQKIVYAWARNAPALSLPSGIGYRIGKAAHVGYLVIQMHYSQRTEPGKFDCSGFSAMVTRAPQSYTAGIYLLGSGSILIPPMSKYSKSDVSCRLRTSSPLHVFAFRTHAHSLGKVITAYRSRNEKTTMVGKGNPQWPHAFYPRVGGSLELRDGDILLARCVYTSNRTVMTHVGMRGNDEMCNFYMMYYTNQTSDEGRECWGMTVPHSERLFPQSADDPAPYPGFAGQDSIQAIARGEAVMPSVPAEHHHHHHHESNTPEERPTYASTKHDVNTKAEPREMPRLQLNSQWSPPSNIGQVGGVAVDSRGYLHVFHRAARVWDRHSFDPRSNVFIDKQHPIQADTIAMLDPGTGVALQSWGKGLFFLPHGISFDRQDNIWLTDVAMHQVMKFPINGSSVPLLTLGQKLVPGDDEQHFCKPADVAVDDSGFIYVADGYCNSRIVKFDPNGRFMLSWGKYGSRSREGWINPGFFDIPHSVVLAAEQVCVADRENGRVQCFGKQGNFVRNLEFRSKMGDEVYAVTYSPPNQHYGGVFYVVNGEGNRRVRTCGFTIGATSGELVGEWCPSREQQLSRPHDVAVSPDGANVFVGELSGTKLYKFVAPLLQPPIEEENVGSSQRLKTTKRSPAAASPPTPTTIPSSVITSSKHSAINTKSLPVTTTTRPFAKLIIPTPLAHKKDAVVDEQDWTVVIVITLLVLPLLAGVLGCLVVRNRRNRLKQYQDLLGHDVIDSYGYPSQSKFKSFFSKSSNERRGFTAVRDDDDSSDALSDFEDDAAVIRR